MKVLGIIPARYGSTRFPGKPLIDIQGKSMIQRVYEQALKAEIFTKVVVATDDARIFESVLSFGGQAMMTSENHTCGTDRCIEVLESEKDKYDVVVNIQGDEPVIDPAQLTAVCGAFDDPQTQISTLVKKIESQELLNDVSKIKVARAKNGDALYFSRQPIPYSADKNSAIEKGEYYKHIGIYAFKTEVLLAIKNLEPSALEISESLEQLRWLENGYPIKTVETKIDSISVDTPKDIERVLAILNGK